MDEHSRLDSWSPVGEIQSHMGSEVHSTGWIGHLHGLSPKDSLPNEDGDCVVAPRHGVNQEPTR